MNTANYHADCNIKRAQAYYQKLLAYYGGVLPLAHYQRVNRGILGLERLRQYWRQRDKNGRAA